MPQLLKFKGYFKFVYLICLVKVPYFANSIQNLTIINKYSQKINVKIVFFSIEPNGGTSKATKQKRSN